MAVDGGVPAIRRLISKRLRGRLSGSVFIRSWDSKLKKDGGRGGGANRQRFFLLLCTLARLIVKSLVLFLKPSDLPEHL